MLSSPPGCAGNHQGIAFLGELHRRGAGDPGERDLFLAGHIAYRADLRPQALIDHLLQNLVRAHRVRQLRGLHDAFRLDIHEHAYFRRARITVDDELHAFDDADLDAEDIDRRAARQARDRAGEISDDRDLVLVAGGFAHRRGIRYRGNTALSGLGALFAASSGRSNVTPPEMMACSD